MMKWWRKRKQLNELARRSRFSGNFFGSLSKREQEKLKRAVIRKLDEEGIFDP